MTSEFVTALFEAARAGAELAGFPDFTPDTIEILPDRDYSWCGVDDDYVELNEKELPVESPISSPFGSPTDFSLSAEETSLV